MRNIVAFMFYSDVLGYGFLSLFPFKLWVILHLLMNSIVEWCVILHVVQSVYKETWPWPLLCVWAEFSAPVIKLNSSPLNGSEIVWAAKEPLRLLCEGQEEVMWRTRVARLQKHVSRSVLSVPEPGAEHTGTYRCSYKSHTHLYSEIHIYVKGMCTITITVERLLNLKSLFQTMVGLILFFKKQNQYKAE